MRGKREEALWRFMSKVDEVDGCWLWTGGRNSLGYPTFNPEPGNKVYAARWIAGLLGVSLREGRVSVTCGDTRCVRPSHITVVRAADTFWGRAREDESGCWVWTGKREAKGYGRHSDGMLAHRYAYEAMFGPIPDGLVLDHMCERPGCINPWHLDPVPQSVNVDRHNHGRPEAARVAAT